MPTQMTSTEAREKIVEAIELDLIGPTNDHVFAKELLPEAPSRWYLAGFLTPVDASEEERFDPQSQEQQDAAGEEPDSPDDSGKPDPTSGKTFLPSSMGLSVLVPADMVALDVIVQWGDYVFEGEEDKEDDILEEAEAGMDKKKEAEGSGEREAKTESPKGFRRDPREESVTVELDKLTRQIKPFPVPNSGKAGLEVVATLREVSAQTGLPEGTKSLSLFLVNRRSPKKKRYQAWAFQVKMIVHGEKHFVARPDLRGLEGHSNALDEWDTKVANLHYRDVQEFAVGHGVSIEAIESRPGECHEVRTCWVPKAEVNRVAPNESISVTLGMDDLAKISDGTVAKTKLMPLVEQYRTWIEAQKKKRASLSSANQQILDDLLANAAIAAKRIEKGIELLSNPPVLEAFQVMNRAMAASSRQRQLVQNQGDASKVKAPRWRPFQLAFILLTMRGIVEPESDDRETVDLLFFPTGGGKTEAYLGLAAFTIVLRRLRHKGIHSAGVTVLMRYTLRLLTLDQLGRAAALVCALEQERESNPQLGEWPFEIGLWVGSAATPNIMGYKGYKGPGADKTARKKTIDFNSDDKRPAPIPLAECPWCGAKFTRDSFRLMADGKTNVDSPKDLVVKCADYNCEFSGDKQLPIVGVDEPIYRRLPAFLIATVDKFAALPWVGRTGALFGHVDRYDKDGFYGPADPKSGQALGGPLPPPELIIQDELHLISGPLGTIAGLYETVVDELASRTINEKKVRPKIVASTATVRRAESQIQALFERPTTAVFPPPGPDTEDSFFAITQPPPETPARLYIGIAAQGRSLKVIMLRTALALMSSAQTLYKKNGGKANRLNTLDPYMTLVGYFNSLRELGGSRRIFEDEVVSRLERYGSRRRREPLDELFADRKFRHEIEELTSRVSTNDVANAKRLLSQLFCEDEAVDVAIATNMISVGLDIIRLGTMFVNGQPKTTAEYIQATSRVGRDAEKPGLVVTLFNIHKPRDRSHYERFPTFHRSFYRSVEATSVTPFSPRALDRALAATLVGLCRQGFSFMTPSPSAAEIESRRNDLETAAQRFAQRAVEHRQISQGEATKLYDYVLNRCKELLDDWLTIQQNFAQQGTRLIYNRSEAAGGKNEKNLLYDPLDPELQIIEPVRRNFRANRSMRDVEAGVECEVKELYRWGTKNAGQ